MTEHKSYAMHAACNIGDRIPMGKFTLICNKALNKCDGCFFDDAGLDCGGVQLGPCNRLSRKDDNDVIFVLELPNGIEG